MFNNFKERFQSQWQGTQRLATILASKQMSNNVVDFLKSKSKVASFVAFTSAYWYLLGQLRKSEDEVKRIAAAGSIMVNFVELSFYFGDTINSKSKVAQESISFLNLLNNVLKEDGANALTRGISVTYYGSIFYGGSYFYTYPWLKIRGHDWFEKRDSLPLLYFLSAYVSEYVALLLYFPFETVKVRFQTQSDHQYTGVLDGILHVFKNDGFKFIYQGYFWYAMHYSLNYSVQIALYETMIDRYKERYPEKFYGNEFYYISQTAFLCGTVGSAISNPIEVIAVCKQANPRATVRSIIGNQSYYNLLTRGMFVRVCYHSTQSCWVWLAIHYIGKAFNVDLTEIA